MLNLLANSSCTVVDKMNPGCNIVGTLGNHEFDEGKVELLRLLNGGNFATGPFLEDPYGARASRTCRRTSSTGRRIAADLPPLVIKQSHGVPIAFIGAVLEGRRPRSSRRRASPG